MKCDRCHVEKDGLREFEASRNAGEICKKFSGKMLCRECYSQPGLWDAHNEYTKDIKIGEMYCDFVKRKRKNEDKPKGNPV